MPLADSVQHGDPVVTSLYALTAASVLIGTGSRWLSRVHEYPEPAAKRQIKDESATS